jgi:effector-binding domain-containing protein
MQFGLAYRNIVSALSIHNMDYAEVKELYSRLIRQIKEENKRRG